jgi:preprotein translocase subunit SecE
MAKTALATPEQSKGLRSKDSESGENKPNPLVEHATSRYETARGFLTDVRAEMRKVVTPSRKEVQATTTVVLATVFIFAFYFWVVDSIFTYGLAALMAKLVGPQ